MSRMSASIYHIISLSSLFVSCVTFIFLMPIMKGLSFFAVPVACPFGVLILILHFIVSPILKPGGQKEGGGFVRRVSMS